MEVTENYRGFSKLCHRDGKTTVVETMQDELTEHTTMTQLGNGKEDDKKGNREIIERK